MLFGTKKNISFRMTTYVDTSVDMWITLNQDYVVFWYCDISQNIICFLGDIIWYVGTSLLQDSTGPNRMSDGNVCEWYLMLRWLYTLSARCSNHMIQALYMLWCAIWYDVTLSKNCMIWWYGIGLALYIYIYIYTCVCACVCVFVWPPRVWQRVKISKSNDHRIICKF